MGLPWFATLEVERLRGTTTDDFHGGTTDWANPNRLMLYNCWFGRPSGVELSEGRQTVVTDVWWWGDEDADVDEGDRLRDVERDITYDVAGPVLYERDPRDNLNHKTCQVREVRG
jgi:hypothetical protein